MARKLIVDTNSIINFNKYYSFDKQDKNKIQKKLQTFILSKLEKGEIVIIDKVLQELQNPESKTLKNQMKSYQYTTEHLLDKIEPLFDENLIEIRARNFPDIELEIERNQYTEKYADLYLIAVCEELKEQDNQVILISEESFSNDQKIVEKLPTICNKKDIEYRNLPYMLFTIYKNELIFNLEIKN